MTDSTLQLLAARAHIAAGRLRSAERALQTIVGRPAAPAEAQHMLARVRADLVRHGALGEARPEASRDINADFVRAVEAAKQGKVEEAIRLYRNVIAAAPKLAQAYSNLGTLYRDQNRLNEAIETYRAGIRAAPNFPALHYNIGFALLGQRKHEEARDAYGRALALKPDWPQTYYNLGIIAQETQQYAEAVEFYQQCLALDPNNRHCANNMGNSLMALGRVDDAIVAFGRAVDLAPTTNKANAAAGASAGDPFEVGEPISEPDGHANARFNRALAYLVKGDYTRGWADYSRRFEDATISRLAGYREQKIPRWRGEDLRGKTILVLA
ncbi:MAG: tetratricopeptide repeat protein, partial [Alphaproteobacteria bacterium]